MQEHELVALISQLFIEADRGHGEFPADSTPYVQSAKSLVNSHRTLEGYDMTGIIAEVMQGQYHARTRHLEQAVDSYEAWLEKASTHITSAKALLGE